MDDLQKWKKDPVNLVREAVREITVTKTDKPEAPPRLEVMALQRQREQCSECKGSGKVRRKVGWSPTSGTIGVRIEYEHVPCPICRREAHVKYMTGCRGGPDPIRPPDDTPTGAAP